jgi:AraC-like DNA-binding protein
MDPLSDVLSLLKPRSYMASGFEAGGTWSIQFPRHGGIKCYAVVSGECWLAVEGLPDPLRIQAGDCFILPTGRPFRLANDMNTTPVAVQTVFPPPARNGGIITHNGGGDFSVIGGHFILTGSHASILLGMLPPIAHIRKESDKAALRWSIERMMQEMREREPGGFLIVQHLAYMMLIQALRLHLAEGLKGGVGWLFALADRQMNAAISAMHGDPAFRWTLQALAGHAGMSRSTFALRFKETVGSTPMEYLTQWRMLLAADRLTSSGDPISVISMSLGYESESAFSTAFKRVMGCSPRQYSRDRNHSDPAVEENGAGRAGRLELVAG